MKVLGLDVSTSCIGFAVANDQYVEAYGAIDMRNKKHWPDIFEKATEATKRIVDATQEEQIEAIYIEQNLFMFQQGASSAKVLNQLSKFNGMISILMYEKLGLKPEYVSSGTARKLNDIKISKGQKAKAVVMQKLLDTLPNFSVEYTPKGNIKPFYYDIADAIVVARAGVILENEKRNLPNSK